MSRAVTSVLMWTGIKVRETIFRMVFITRG